MFITRRDRTAKLFTDPSRRGGIMTMPGSYLVKRFGKTFNGLQRVYLALSSNAYWINPNEWDFSISECDHI